MFKYVFKFAVFILVVRARLRDADQAKLDEINNEFQFLEMSKKTHFEQQMLKQEAQQRDARSHNELRKLQMKKEFKDQERQMKDEIATVGSVRTEDHLELTFNLQRMQSFNQVKLQMSQLHFQMKDMHDKHELRYLKLKEKNKGRELRLQHEREILNFERHVELRYMCSEHDAKQLTLKQAMKQLTVKQQDSQQEKLRRAVLKQEIEGEKRRLENKFMLLEFDHQVKYQQMRVDAELDELMLRQQSKDEEKKLKFELERAELEHKIETDEILAGYSLKKLLLKQ